MHTTKTFLAAGLAAVAMAGAAQASVVLTESWAANGDGNRSYNLNSGGFTTTTFNINDTGRLDSFAFYLLDDPVYAPAPGTGTIDFTLWSGSAGFTGSTQLETLSITEADVYASNTVTSQFDFSFYEVVLDLSGFDVRVTDGETYSLSATVDGTGTYQIIGTGRASTSYGPNLGFSPYVNRTFSTIAPGGSGSVAFANSFAVFVDTDPDAVDPVDPTGPSPIPVPAGLPLLMGGLGALAIARRRGRA